MRNDIIDNGTPEPEIGIPPKWCKPDLNAIAPISIIGPMNESIPRRGSCCKRPMAGNPRSINSNPGAEPMM